MIKKTSSRWTLSILAIRIPAYKKGVHGRKQSLEALLTPPPLSGTS